MDINQLRSHTVIYITYKKNTIFISLRLSSIFHGVFSETNYKNTNFQTRGRIQSELKIIRGVTKCLHNQGQCLITSLIEEEL